MDRDPRFDHLDFHLDLRQDRHPEADRRVYDCDKGGRRLRKVSWKISEARIMEPHDARRGSIVKNDGAAMEIPCQRQKPDDGGQQSTIVAQMVPPVIDADDCKDRTTGEGGASPTAMPIAQENAQAVATDPRQPMTCDSDENVWTNKRIVMLSQRAEGVDLRDDPLIVDARKQTQFQLQQQICAIRGEIKRFDASKGVGFENCGYHDVILVGECDGWKKKKLHAILKHHVDDVVGMEGIVQPVEEWAAYDVDIGGGKRAFVKLQCQGDQFRQAETSQFYRYAEVAIVAYDVAIGLDARKSAVAMVDRQRAFMKTDSVHLFVGMDQEQTRDQFVTKAIRTIHPSDHFVDLDSEDGAKELAVRTLTELGNQMRLHTNPVSVKTKRVSPRASPGAPRRNKCVIE